MAKKTTSPEAPYQCPKERELATLVTKVNALEKVMHDNGHDGLITTVHKLSGGVSDLNKQMTANNEIIGDIRDFIRDYKTAAKIREDLQKQEVENLNRRYRFLTSALGVFGALATVAIIFFGNGVLKVQANEKQMYMQKVDSSTVIYFRGGYYPVDSAYWNDAENPLKQPK